MDLYTKKGVPLRVVNSTVYSRTGKVVGRIKEDKVFGTDGKYVGTIVDGRLVYRSTHRSKRGAVFSASRKVGFARAKRAGRAMWGDEPYIDE